MFVSPATVYRGRLPYTGVYTVVNSGMMIQITEGIRKMTERQEKRVESPAPVPLIGGPLDGNYHSPKAPKNQCIFRPGDFDTAFDQQGVYYLERLGREFSFFYFYRWCELTPEETIEALLANYRPGTGK